jgi:hypothetical protein
VRILDEHVLVEDALRRQIQSLYNERLLTTNEYIRLNLSIRELTDATKQKYAHRLKKGKSDLSKIRTATSAKG